MIEDDWRSCREPLRMLGPRVLKGKVSDRKRRLFLCGCCRLIWDLLPDDRGRERVEVCERFADGLVPRDEFARLRYETGAVTAGIPDQTQPYFAAVSTLCPSTALKLDLGHCRSSIELTQWATRKNRREALAEAQCDLIRDIFGVAFRPEPFQPDWATPTVVELARGIYDDRAFGRMPILGDALEESGCTSPRVLDHCRGREPHARGCWVLDGVLGRS